MKLLKRGISEYMVDLHCNTTFWIASENERIYANYLARPRPTKVLLQKLNIDVASRVG